MTRQLYNLAKIRDLLVEGFDDRELRRLCFDVPDFRPVYNELARGTGKAAIVDRLLEHAEKTMQVPALLALAEALNPARYEHHGPYYVEDPTPRTAKDRVGSGEAVGGTHVSDDIEPRAAVSDGFALARAGGKGKAGLL
jgi:hypothetical protein